MVNKKRYKTLNSLTSLPQGEKTCLNVIRYANIYGTKQFSKIRHPDIINPVTNKPLELDLYNHKMKMAVEYNGKQHYEKVQYFHKKEESFNDQVARDNNKRLLCDMHGIKLITVPYTYNSSRSIEDYIISQIGTKFNDYNMSKTADKLSHKNSNSHFNNNINTINLDLGGSNIGINDISLAVPINSTKLNKVATISFTKNNNKNTINSLMQYYDNNSINLATPKNYKNKINSVMLNDDNAMHKLKYINIQKEFTNNIGGKVENEMNDHDGLHMQFEKFHEECDAETKLIKSTNDIKIPPLMFMGKKIPVINGDN